MKYKLLKFIEKETHPIPLGTTFYFTDKWFTMSNGFQVKMEELIEQGFIEEVVETPKPRWKVGDYVVNEIKDYSKQFIKISNVAYIPGNNNYKYRYNGFLEPQLREPTPEELSIYFR